MATENKENTKLPNNDLNFRFRGYNSGAYTWTTGDEAFLQNMLNTETGKCFESEDFVMAQLKWKIKLYPNGKKSANAGNVIISLVLVSMPSEIEKMTCSYSIKCNHSQSACSSMAAFTKSGQTKDLPNKSLLLSEWQSMDLNTISITVSVKINSLLLKDSSDYLKLCNLIQPFNPSELKYKSKAQYVWTINKDTMKTFLQSHNGKTFESHVLDHMFILRMYPNGETIKNKGFVSVYLKLCTLPPFISKMNTKYSIVCNETNANYSSTKEFSFDKKNDGEKKFMRLEEIETQETVTFTIEIAIVNVEFVEMGKERSVHFVYAPTQISNILALVSKEEDVYMKHKMLERKLDSFGNNMTTNNKTIQEMQNNIQQMMKQMSDIQSIIIGTKNNTELDDEKVCTNLKEKTEPILMATDATETESAMAKWMKYTVKLPQYISLFNDNGLDDMETVKYITMKELTMIGLAIVGHRIKIEKEIEKLNQR